MNDTEARCMKVASLNPEIYRDNEMHRRVYSIEGTAPTIRSRDHKDATKIVLEGGQ